MSRLFWRTNTILCQLADWITFFEKAFMSHHCCNFQVQKTFVISTLPFFTSKILDLLKKNFKRTFNFWQAVLNTIWHPIKSRVINLRCAYYSFDYIIYVCTGIECDKLGTKFCGHTPNFYYKERIYKMALRHAAEFIYSLMTSLLGIICN